MPLLVVRLQEVGLLQQCAVAALVNAGAASSVVARGFLLCTMISPAREEDNRMHE